MMRKRALGPFDRPPLYAIRERGFSCDSINLVNARNGSNRLRVAALAGILIGFGLRLHRLGAESLWYDETVSAYLSRLAPGALVAHTARDIHPPGYYLLLHTWRSLAQPSLNHGLEFGLAWLSLFWGMLIVVLVAAVGAKLFDRRVGVLALWFAAVNPFHLWYGQEVRMYTQGAALGLLCLWFVLRWLDDTRRVRWLVAYAVTAAAGLYTLYYFAFLLIALALVTLLALWDRARPGTRITAGVRWLAAQFGVLLLYAPWLPVLWRQATEPPVPPWRAPWTSLDAVLMPLNESLAALVAGQSPPLATLWPWAWVTALVALAAVVLPLQRRAHRSAWAVGLMLLTVFVPFALIVAVTLWGTPLYHVRYGFTYAAGFAVVAAVAVDELWRRRRWLGLGAGAVLLMIALVANREFWTNPAYRADDHRGAVAALAQQWRPGDAILVNAGWAYTALDTYWPQTLVGPRDSVPSPIARRQRLTDDAAPHPDDARATVTVLQTGSVNGPATLGWGDPASDFYAMPAAATIDALDTLATHHPRLWHYRIYDTVSDPDGLIREWLDANATLLEDVAHPGRDFLRTQLYAMNPTPATTDAGSPTLDDVAVGDGLTLTAHSGFTPQPAGTPLYTELHWHVDDVAAVPAELRTSLRLYAEDGAADGAPVAQADGPPQPAASTWTNGATVRQPLALAVPAALPPGTYAVELIVYDGATGAPLAVADVPQSVDGQRIRLGQVEVTLPTQPVPGPRPPARFDYIYLLEAGPAAAVQPPGSTLIIDLVWRPRPSDYRDTYDAILELRRGDAVVAEWRDAMGGSYPSGAWAAHVPVLDQRRLPMPADLPPGEYTLRLRVERASDGLPIPARAGLWPRSRESLPVATITVPE